MRRTPEHCLLAALRRSEVVDLSAPGPLLAAASVPERNAAPLLPGAKQAAIVLRVPRGVSNVLGRAVYKAIIVEKSFAGLSKEERSHNRQLPRCMAVAGCTSSSPLSPVVSE